MLSFDSLVAAFAVGESTLAKKTNNPMEILFSKFIFSPKYWASLFVGLSGRHHNNQWPDLKTFSSRKRNCCINEETEIWISNYFEHEDSSLAL